MNVDVSYTLDKLGQYRELETDEKEKKIINSYINTLKESGSYVTNFDKILDIVKKFDETSIDEVLCKIYLEFGIYNSYIANRKVKEVTPLLEKDIDFDEVSVRVDDILNYLDTSKEEIDSDLYKKLIKSSKIDSIKDFATTIKTSTDSLRVLYDKIEDRNVLVSILLYSDLDTIKSIDSLFKENNANINKVASNIPSIFIKNGNKSSIGNYEMFFDNVHLLKEYDINFKTMLKYPVFFINDVNKNRGNILRLIQFGVKPKNVLEYVGGVFVVSPNIIFNNLSVLKFYNIELTDDNNNNGYTILGVTDLDERIDYLIEQKKWINNESVNKGKDNIDLIRALSIRENYFDCKNDIKRDKIDSALFGNGVLTDEVVESLYTKYPVLKELDMNYLKDNTYYQIGINNTISKHRLLKNLNNYVGKDDAILSSLLFKSNINDEEVVRKSVSNLSTLEMSESNVKLSKGI